MSDISSFLSELASFSSPAPGGAACSAFALVQVADLTAKVLSLSKEEFANEDPKSIEKAIEFFESARTRLLFLIEEGSKACFSLTDALKLPETTPKEIEERNKRIQTSYIEAAMVPIKVLEVGELMGEFVLLTFLKANRDVVSEAFCAAKLYEAGIQGAIFNAKTFIPYLSHPKAEASVRKFCAARQKNLNSFSREFKVYVKEVSSKNSFS